MKLGERGGREVGVQPPGRGKRRGARTREKVAARVAKFLAGCAAPSREVRLLNRGFFQLEQMRSQSTPKARAEARKKVQG